MADKSPDDSAARSTGESAAKPAAESAPATTTPARATAEAAETEAEHIPVIADVKSAFAAALERKKQAGQARSAHLDGHGGVGGATSSHKATRTFRRKSGSA